MEIRFGLCPWGDDSPYRVQDSFKAACKEAIREQVGTAKIDPTQYAGLNTRLQNIERTVAAIATRLQVDA